MAPTLAPVGFTETLEIVVKRRFQSTEGKITLLCTFHGPGEIDGLWIPTPGGSLNGRATGIPQAQQPGPFVKGLTGGIVQRTPQQSILTNAVDLPEVGMSPAYEEAEIRIAVSRGQPL